MKEVKETRLKMTWVEGEKPWVLHAKGLEDRLISEMNKQEEDIRKENIEATIKFQYNKTVWNYTKGNYEKACLLKQCSEKV